MLMLLRPRELRSCFWSLSLSPFLSNPSQDGVETHEGCAHLYLINGGKADLDLF